MIPNCFHKGSYETERERLQVEGEEASYLLYIPKEVDIGAMQPQINEDWQPPKAGRVKE